MNYIHLSRITFRLDADSIYKFINNIVNFKIQKIAWKTAGIFDQFLNQYEIYETS